MGAWSSLILNASMHEMFCGRNFISVQFSIIIDSLTIAFAICRDSCVNAVAQYLNTFTISFIFFASPFEVAFWTEPSILTTCNKTYRHQLVSDNICLYFFVNLLVTNSCFVSQVQDFEHMLFAGPKVQETIGGTLRPTLDQDVSRVKQFLLSVLFVLGDSWCWMQKRFLWQKIGSLNIIQSQIRKSSRRRFQKSSWHNLIFFTKS